MQHDLFRPGHTLTLVQVFKMTFYYCSSDAVLTRATRCWQDECRAFAESKVITENFFVETVILYFRVPFFLWRLNCNRRSNLRTRFWKRVKRTIECVLLRRCILVSELCAALSKNVAKPKFDLWWWPDLWPYKKWLQFWQFTTRHDNSLCVTSWP